MAAKKRIYIVNGGDLTAHLVKATSKAVAINHIAKKDITAHVANQMELVEMLGSGTEVEDASPVEEDPTGAGDE